MTGVRDRARVLSDGDRNEIAALRADGWTHAHIAAHFGVGIFVVRRVLDPAALRASERASRRRAAAGRAACWVTSSWLGGNKISSRRHRTCTRASGNMTPTLMYLCIR